MNFNPSQLRCHFNVSTKCASKLKMSSFSRGWKSREKLWGVEKVCNTERSFSPDFRIETFTISEYSRLMAVTIARQRDFTWRRRMNADDGSLAHDFNSIVEGRIRHVIVQVDEFRRLERVSICRLAFVGLQRLVQHQIGGNDCRRWLGKLFD